MSPNATCVKPTSITKKVHTLIQLNVPSSRVTSLLVQTARRRLNILHSPVWNMTWI
ncbi:unnamed protein product [Timema podura]|uniref:Uncharacterized protein n=1 Tax=Timema podura TaxID=61482 RepID=A0ABN7NP02_TIMPD|nr:unnamed protein product [Timema podura]